MFQLTFAINAPAALTYPYFHDVMTFGRVHPIIQKVEKEGENQYRVHEKVYLLWLFKYEFSYPFYIESATAGEEVVMVGHPKKNLCIRIRIVFKVITAEQTEIQEFVEVTGGFFQRKVAEYFIKKSHKKIAEIIRGELGKVISKN